MKTVSTLLLAGALALGTGAAFAQSSSGTTSGNSSMTAPSTPNTGATTTQGDQKQATTPGTKGKNAKSKSKMTTGSGMSKRTMTKGATGSTSAKPSTQTDPMEKDSTGKNKKAIQ